MYVHRLWWYVIWLWEQIVEYSFVGKKTLRIYTLMYMYILAEVWKDAEQKPLSYLSGGRYGWDL